MTETAVGSTRSLRIAGQVVVATVVAWLTVLDVSVLGTSAVNGFRTVAGFQVWSLFSAALALSPFVVVYLRWRRSRREGVGLAAALWACTLALLVVGVALLPFTLVIIAV